MSIRLHDAPSALCRTNIVTADRSPEWQDLGWRLASSTADVGQQVTYHFRAVIR
jgi:hypothetical protein